MFSFSLDNLTLPFELSERENTLLAFLKITLGVASEIDKPPKTTNKRKELAFISIKNDLPERVIKFLLVDPALIPDAEHDELKDYWKQYVESYQYEYHTESFNFTIQAKTETTPAAYKNYPIKLRDDVSYAKQAMALFCFIQDKNFAKVRDEEIRHQWRMLAAKYGSLHATIRATKTAAATLISSSSFMPNNEQIKIINDTLNLLTESIFSHGTASLYVLAHFCVSMRKRFIYTSELNVLYECAFTALSLANKSFSLSGCQASLSDVTFGNPNNFFYINFDNEDLEGTIQEVKTAVGDTTTSNILSNTELTTSLLSTIFVQHNRAADNLSNLKARLNIPLLSMSD